MRLESSNNQFFKFKQVGDMIVGHYVFYKEDQPGKFGPQDILALRKWEGISDGQKVRGEDEVSVPCPASLSRTLEQHASELAGKILSIKYTGSKPSGKGNPMKTFDVDASEPGDAADVEF